MSERVNGVRDQVIAALSYPRLLMEQEVKAQACEQHYQFNETVEACNDCLYVLECQSNSDRLSVENLHQASSSELSKLLSFGYEYVSYQLSRDDHETAQCDCQSCGWIRDVAPLLDSV
ncbi:MAG: hypothetical protein OQL20_12930 [Sedimenticola sp.]|nr:hypothetical protein [Sedimenticola sp.]